MKISLTGKGGVGKTTLAAMLARMLARSTEVVAVDADPNPNLAIALGMGLDEAARVPGVANALLAERLENEEGGGHSHPHEPRERTPEELVEEFGAVTPGGVRLVQTGRIERPSKGCLCCGSHRTTRQLYDELDASGLVLVADLEAGVNDLMWAWPKPEDVVLVVTEPYMKSLEVARRAAQVAKDLDVREIYVVANRVSQPDDLDIVRKVLPGFPVVAVPDDPAVAAAAREALSPVDTAPDCPAVSAVAEFAAVLLDRAPLPHAAAAAGGATGRGPAPKVVTGTGQSGD